MTGAREAQLLEAVNLLADARRTLQPMDDLPEALKPAGMDEVFWVQDQLVNLYGGVGGWKVGAGSPEATPLAAPMPAMWMGLDGSTLTHHRFRGIEAEVAFLLKADLPPRATPYSHDEVYAAVASCHPAIEVLESGLTDPTAALEISKLADLSMHGGFIHGPACPDWAGIDFSKESVSLSLDGVVRVERTGSNTAGDLLRLLPWLANAGSARTGGLRAGQWITTGSWTGYIRAESSSSIAAHFAKVGSVHLRFAV
jgi:2-keto-4-pentenoate hydratase